MKQSNARELINGFSYFYFPSACGLMYFRCQALGSSANKNNYNKKNVCPQHDCENSDSYKRVTGIKTRRWLGNNWDGIAALEYTRYLGGK